MAIDSGIVQQFNADILQTTPGTDEELDAIIAYYQYLTAQGDVYAPLALQVATNVGDFGQIANNILIEAGFSDSLDLVRRNLALSDSADRITNLENQGDGLISPSVIAEYHYSVYRDIGIPESAWGGAFFEEFVGTGSWIDLAQTGVVENLQLGLALLGQDILFNNLPPRNGVDASDAVGFLLGGGTATNDSIGYTLDVASANTFTVGLSFGLNPVSLVAAIAALDITSTIFTYWDEAGEFANLVGKQLEIASDGTFSLITDAVGASIDLLNDLGALVGLFEQDSLTVNSAGDIQFYKVLPTDTGDNVLQLTTDASIADGQEGVDTLDYSQITTSGVDVDMAAGNTILTSGGPFITVFDNIENITGTDFNDRINGDLGDNTLNGGAGDDILEGFGGLDTFEFTGNFGNGTSFK